MLVVLLARLLIIVKRLYKASSLDVSEKPEGSSDNLAQAMLQYIRRHYRSDIGTETIAKALGISKKHACRVFKAATGQRISSFINSYRIAEAKNLLVNTDMNITEIAFAVGYSSSAYFSYRFRESTGLSPSEYRTKYRIFV